MSDHADCVAAVRQFHDRLAAISGQFKNWGIVREPAFAKVARDLYSSSGTSGNARFQ